MGTSQSEVDAWSAAQLGEKLDQASPDDLKAIRQAGILPPEVSEILATVENHYDPQFMENPEEWPSRAENTEKYERILRRWTSKILSKAVHNGHDRVINRFLGIVEEETSIDGVQVMLRFIKWVSSEAGVFYLAGHMGTGKTDFGLLMLEVFHRNLEDSERGVKIATNIKSTAEHHDHVEFIDNQPGLQGWLEDGGEYKMFLFDEASSHASGYSGDASKVTRQFRSMIRLIRKNNGSMVIVGHDGKDLHPTVRELADYVEKQDKKDAAAFESVNDREGEDKKFDLSEIPETNLWYNTKEASTWEWASDGEDGKTLEIIMGETYVETELNQDDVAEIFDVSQSKVSDAKTSYLGSEWAQT
jgi:hypothetical protein